jgi:hypothetical protein
VARLRADGHSVNQLLILRLDPRIRTPAAGLRQLAALSREMYNLAAAAHAAHVEARTLVDSLTGATLESASKAALAAAMAMQDADVTPTAAQVAACARARAQATQVLARWARLKRQRR